MDLFAGLFNMPAPPVSAQVREPSPAPLAAPGFEGAAADPGVRSRTRTRQHAEFQEDAELAAGNTLLTGRMSRLAPHSNEAVVHQATSDLDSVFEKELRAATMEAVLNPDFRLEHAGGLHPESATWQPGKDESDYTLRYHFWVTATAAACGPHSLYQFKVHPGLLVTTRTTCPRDECAMYLALTIPVNDQFLRSSRLPLLAESSHMTLSYAMVFHTWPAFWKFKTVAASLLCERIVTCRFLATSSERRFAVDPTCELWSVGLMIREVAMEFGEEIEVWDKMDLHITWHKGM